MAFRLARFTIRLEGGKKGNLPSSHEWCFWQTQLFTSFKLHFTRVKGRLQKSHIQYNLKLNEHPAMLVQSNYEDSPIQDCAHVSQVWSMLLFYNHRSFNLPNSNAFVLCPMYQGNVTRFWWNALGFINKENFLFSLTVMFLEYYTYKFHGKAFKLMPLSFSVKLLSRYPFYYVNWNCFMILKCNQYKWKPKAVDI